MATMKYAQEKTMRIYINGMVEAFVVTNMTQAEEEYITRLFYKCVNTTSPKIQLGIRFRRICANNIEVLGNNHCFYKDSTHYILSFSDAVTWLLCSKLCYTRTEREYVDLCRSLRNKGISCWHGKDEYEGKFFITAKNPCEVNEMYRLVNSYLQLNDSSLVHIGNNCIWIPEELLYVNKEVTYCGVEILDSHKVNSFRGKLKAEFTMHTIARML